MHLEIQDIRIQIVFELLIYFWPIFLPRMHRNRWATGLCIPPDPPDDLRGGAPEKGKENKKGKEKREGEHPQF